MIYSISPLPIVLQTIRVGLKSNSIWIHVFELALVNSIAVYFYSEAMAFVFKKLPLVLLSIRPCEGPLSVKGSMVKFAFI